MEKEAEKEAKWEGTSGELLVDSVKVYVAMVDDMADLFGRTFGNMEEVQSIVRDIKASGQKVIGGVSRYTKAVDNGLNALKKSFEVSK